MSNKNHKKEEIKIDLLDKELVENVARYVLNQMEQNEGMTLKDAAGISDESLEEVYSLAYTFYNQGKYQEAIALFQFLASSSPDTYKYMLGLGAAYHQNKAYEEAVSGFYIALSLDPENPIPCYYIVDSLIQLNRLEEAKGFAELAVMICEDQEQYKELKERCALIRKSLNDKK